MALVEKPEKEGKIIEYKNIRIKTTNLDAERTPESNEIPQISYLKNTLTQREISEGWKLLWDGKTTNGWRGSKIKEFPKKGWYVEDGELKVEATDGGESTHCEIS